MKVLKKVIKASTGSAEDMLNAFKSKLSTMSIESASSITDNPYDDDCQELKDSISDELELEVDDVHCHCTDEALVVVVKYMSNIINFDVPYEELTGDVEDDTAYVVNTVLYELDNME